MLEVNGTFQSGTATLGASSTASNGSTQQAICLADGTNCPSTTGQALTMNNSGSGAASGTTFNGATAQTLSYNTIGASPLAGSSSLTTVGTLSAGSIPYSLLTGTPTIGTWGALNYPTWASGTPFVKMTAAGTFALDTNSYLTSSGISGMTAGYIPLAGSATTLTGNSHIDDGVTVIGAITGSEPFILDYSDTTRVYSELYNATGHAWFLNSTGEQWIRLRASQFSGISGRVWHGNSAVSDLYICCGA